MQVFHESTSEIHKTKWNKDSYSAEPARMQTYLFV